MYAFGNCFESHCVLKISNFSLLKTISVAFFLNNQPDALIIQIYSVIKLHVSCIFSAHHQEISTVHSALVSFVPPSSVRMELPFHPDAAWKRSSNLHETYQCLMYSRKLLMMGREDARNM